MAQPAQTSTYRYVWSTSGQNVWGPGADDAPSSAQLNFFSERWGEPDYSGRLATTDDIVSVRDWRFGGEIGGRTEGEISLGARFKGFSAGKLSMVYPADITVTWPAADSFRAGQTVTIGSSMRVDASQLQLNLPPSAGDVQLVGTFGLEAEAEANACLFGCTGDVDLFPEIDIDTSGKILAVSDLVDICGLASDAGLVKPGEGCDVTPTRERPWGGHLSVPTINLTPTLAADGKTVVATGTHRDFMNLNLDIDMLIENMIKPKKLNYDVSVPKAGVGASATTLDAAATLHLSQTQKLTFSPTIEARMELAAGAPDVHYTIKNAQGVIVSSGIGTVITYDVGNKVEIKVPSDLTAGQVLDATTTFSMKQAPNFTNDVTTTLNTDLSAAALAVTLSTPEKEVIPEVCLGFFCTPAVTAPSISVDLGPLWRDRLPVQTVNNTSLFDGDRGQWALSGSGAPVGGGLTLNPEYTPAVTASGPGQLDEGQPGTYAFSFSDADGDRPLNYTLAWGDGAVETGTGDPTGTSFSKSHAFADEGNYVVTLTVSDGHKEVGVAKVPVAVNNVIPAFADVTVTSQLDENGTATLNGKIIDPGKLDSFVLEIDWGGPAGAPEGKETIPLAAGTTSFSRTHQYRDDNGTRTASDAYTVTVTVKDSDMPKETPPVETTVETTIKNVAPTVFAGSDRTIYEGESTGLGIDLYGKNLIAGGDAESGTAGWVNQSGGFTTRPYGPPGSGEVITETRTLVDTNYWNPTQGYANVAIASILNGTQPQFPDTGITLYRGPDGNGESRRVPGVITISDWLAGSSIIQGEHWSDGQDMHCRIGSVRVYGETVAFVDDPYWQNNLSESAVVARYGPGLHNVSEAASCAVKAVPYDPVPAAMNLPEPDLSSANALLGNWLSAPSELNANWRPAAYFWMDYYWKGDMAVVYPLDVPVGGAHLTGQFGANSGIFIWVDGQYRFGAMHSAEDQSDLSTLPYEVDLGDLAVGRHYLQILREHHLSRPDWFDHPSLEVRVFGSTMHGGTLAVDSSGPPAPGAAYFSGGNASAIQEFDLRSIAAAIDSGAVRYSMSGWFGGAGAYKDTSQLTATFKSDTGQTLGSKTIGPVTAADRGNVTKLMERTAEGPIPAGTAKVLLELRTTQNTGTTGEAGADNLSFMVLPAPGARTTAYYTDPGLKDTHTLTVNWGDGTTNTPVASGQPGDMALTGTHTYLDNGTYPYTVTVTAVDDDKGVGIDTFTTTVLNLPPRVTPIEQVFLVGGDGPKVLAAFTDAGALDTHTANIDWGDGNASPGIVDETRGTVSAAHTYNLTSALPVTVTAYVTVEDKDHSPTTVPVTVTVTNLVIPNAAFSHPDQPVTEGGSTTFTGSFSSISFPPGVTPFTPTYDYTLDFGDGTAPATGPATPGTPISKSHTYAEDGSYLPTLTISARDGAQVRTYATLGAPLSVLNSAPAVGPLPGQSITENGSITFNATYSDAGVGDQHTATIDWGDTPEIERATVAQGAGSGSLTGTHTYRQDGTYAVTVTVTDSDGAAGARTFTATVANAAPAIDRTSLPAVAEGTPSVITAVFSDAGTLDTHTATIDWGDGFVTPATVSEEAGSVSGSHVYANNQAYPVKLCITDDGPGKTCANLTAAVTNVAPSPAPVAQQTGKEGDVIAISAAYTDPGPTDTHTAVIDWGDGTTDPVTPDRQAGTVSGSHIYRQSGSYTARVIITDSDEAVGTSTFAVEIANVPPAVNAGPDATVAEGEPFALAPTTFADPGALDTHSATVDWGDGASEAGTVHADGAVTATHAYADNGKYTVNVCVRDEGAPVCDSLSVTVENVPPAVEAGPDVTTTEGAAVALQATVSDPGAADALTTSVDWGDGAVTDGVTGTHTYGDDGIYTVAICSADDDGATACDTFTATVGSVAPTVSAGPDQTAREGDTVAVTATYADPGTLDTHTATVEWGDGTPATRATVDPAARTITAGHRFGDNGAYTVRVCVEDNDGETGCDELTVNVSNVGPTVEAGPDMTSFQGAAVSLNRATFTDPGLAERNTATINWGDGTTTAGEVVPTAGIVTGTHTYYDTGDYTVTVCVADKDGASACDQLQAAVQNVPPAVYAGPDATVDEGAPFDQGAPFLLPIYSSDFSDGAGGAWSTAAVETAPGGERFLGRFGNDAVLLQLGNLPEHQQLDISFDLYLVGSWDGNDKTWGPDLFELSVLGGPSLLTSSFGGAAQSYPGAFPAASYPGGTGAARINALGYAADQVYHLNFSIPHTDAAITLQFLAYNLQELWDESWGIDNVSVSVPVAGPTLADPGRTETWSATVDYGDGTGVQPLPLGADKTFALSHVYADNGTYTVTVTASDSNGGTGTDTIGVTVMNAAPDVTAGPDQAANEGETVSLAPAAFHDPGTADTHTTTVDWGDGTGAQGAVVTESPSGPPGSATGAGGTAAASHCYADDGTYTVTVTVADDDGAAATGTFNVTVANLAPTVSAGADQTTDEGSQVSLAPATFHDQGAADTHTATVDWGDGTGPQPAAVTEQPSGPPGTVAGMEGTVAADHVYADNGVYTVTVTVTDDDHATGTGQFTVTVANLAPVLSAGADQTATEGDFVNLAPASFHDQGTADTHTATVDWGDGTGAQPATVTESPSGLVDASHTYADNGIYTVTVTLSDDDGAAATGSFTVTVANAAPTVNAGPDQTVTEGDTASLAPATFHDPGTADTHTATVDWGDGTGAQSAAVTESPSGLVAAGHVYADDGAYTVTITVTDDDGAVTADTLLVTVRNAAPAVSAGPGQTAHEGETVSLAPAAFHDPGTADTHTVTVDWGDGTGAQDAVVSETPSGPPGLTTGAGGTAAASHVYADDGTYTVTVTVTDDDGAATPGTFQVTVTNLAPLVSAGPDQPADEGNRVSLAPTAFHDQGTADRHTATVDWGDGTGPQPAAVTEQPSGPPGSEAGAEGTVAADHVYADNGVYTVTVAVTDDDHATTTGRFTVTVANLAPVLNAGADQAATEGNTVSLAPASFHDQGTADSHTATVDWGDGTGTQPATVTEQPAGPPGSEKGADGSVTAEHVYADDGTYTVTVSLTDDDGAAATGSFTVTVANAAPAVNAGPAQATTENAPVQLAPSTFHDAGTADTHTATVDWGDGTGVQAAAVSETPSGPPGSTAAAAGTVAAGHTYLDNGTYTVTVTVTDDEGAATASTFAVAVANVPPALAKLGDATLYSGQTHAVTATFTDASPVDTHTAVVTWGDGSPTEPMPVTQGSGSGSAAAAHRYTAPGTYTVSVCVADDDGASVCDRHSVTVLWRPVAVNIKPGGDPSSINLRSSVPVAVLSTAAGEYGLPDSFDATRIDPATVRFGPEELVLAGAGGTEEHGRIHTEDALETDNATHDGDLDALLHFDAAASGLTEATTSVCIRGATADGIYFEGHGAVRVVPDKADGGDKGKGKP